MNISDINKIINILGTGNSAERRVAAKQLATIGNDAIEPLIDALKSGNIFTRKHAAWALGEIGGSRVRGPLKTALKDVDADVRVRAREAIEKTDSIAVKIFKTIIMKPLNIIWINIIAKSSILCDWSHELSETIKIIASGIASRAYLHFGRGDYNDELLSAYYFDLGSGHGKFIQLNEKEIKDMLPLTAPCEECGAILHRPPLGLQFVGACPNCHKQQEYARKHYHAAQAKLLRKMFLKDKTLHMHFLEYLNRRKSGTSSKGM